MPDHVTFTKDATTFDVKAYVYPAKTELMKFQTEEHTEGMTFIGQELANSIEVKVFTFRHLTGTEISNLKNFYDTVVNGKEKTWAFTDSDDTQYTVRWMDSLFDPVLETYNSSSLIMRLLIIS